MNTLIDRIRHNILGLFILLLLFSTAAILWNLVSVMEINREIRDVVLIGEELTELEEAQVFLHHQEIAELEFLLTGNPDFQIQRHEAELMTDFHLARARELQLETDDSIELDNIIAKVDQYERTFSRIDALYREGEVEEAIELSLTSAATQIEDLHHEIGDFVRQSEAIIDEEVQQINGITNREMIVTIVLVVALLALTVLVWRSSNRVVRPILVPTIILSIGVIVWTMIGIQRLNDQVERIEADVHELAKIEQAQVTLLEIDLAGLELLLTSEPSYLMLHRRLSENLRGQFIELTDLPLSRTEAGLVEELRDANRRYHTTFDRIVVALEQRDRQEATRLTTEDANAHISEAHFSIQQFVRIAERSLENELALANQATQTTLTVGILVLGIYAIVGVIVSTVAGQVITPVVQLIDAAVAIEEETYDMSMLDEVTEREDEIGRLARVFQRLSGTVRGRTTELREQVQQLRIEIDEARSLKQVQEILDSDFFKGLEEGAAKMRARRQQRRQQR